MSFRPDEQFVPQAKNTIYSVYKFFKDLSTHEDKPALAAYCRQSQERTAEACGVSLKTVQQICNEKENTGNQAEALNLGNSDNLKFQSPTNNHNREKCVTELNDFDIEMVRRVVHNCYDKGEFPTSSKILAALREKVNYQGSESSLKIILKQLNFKYKKCNDGRKFLMERSDTAAARVKFLRKMNEFRENGDTRPVVYIGEMCVDLNYTSGRIFQNSKNNKRGLKISSGKDSRLIVCHAGSSSFGFIKESKLIFRCDSSNKDYRTQINAIIFKDWFSQMLHYLEEPSIIVMDNVPHHSSLVENYPKINSKKADVQQWLREKNVEFSPIESLAELREKVKNTIPRGKKYKLDELTFQMGHEVVRLPPYHRNYNPTELILAQVKGRVAEKNRNFKIGDVEALVHKEIDAVTLDDWAKHGEDSVKIQEEDFLRAGLRDEILKPIILTFNSDESSLSEDEDDDEDY
uniref:Tc1-like transposase DDE domain-containing protein n=1 Tax=Schizaphis graminum TaxID=13262 RepID=A0A2S2P977_SCHGA